MRRTSPALALVLSVIFLGASGCGGESTAPDPQGFWLGSSASGHAIAAVVLENGQYYSFYSKDGVIEGANYGALRASGWSFSGTLDDIYIPGNQTNSGTISGTFRPKSDLQGLATYNNNTVGAFATNYNASYDTPATLRALAGRYTGLYKSGANAVLNIDLAGNVSGTTTSPGTALPRCLITGSVAPRASGKNVYDLTLQWHDNPALPGNSCCLSSVCATGVSTTGIAVLDAMDSQRIYTGWINAAKTSGFLWTGLKQ